MNALQTIRLMELEFLLHESPDRFDDREEAKELQRMCLDALGWVQREVHSVDPEDDQYSWDTVNGALRMLVNKLEELNVMLKEKSNV